MGASWEPSFNFYLSELEGAVVSFVVDLNARALISHPLRLQIRVALQNPRADGLRDSSELEAMGRVEDQIVDRLTEGLDAVYVGRFITAGATVFVLYLPAEASHEAGAALIGSLDPYETQWLTENDPTWRFFREFLYPDAYAFQSMLSRALLEQLADRGDLLGMPRQIDHLALFELRSEAEQAGGELTGCAFRVRSVSQREDGSWALAFERDESLDDQQADVVVAEILDVVLPLNGRYDGWGCLVIKGSMQ